MEQNHSTTSDPVSRIPSEEEFAKLASVGKPSVIGIYVSLLVEGFIAYKKAVWGLELNWEGEIVRRGFFWVIFESIRVILFRLAAICVSTFMVVLTTFLIALSPAISLIHLPFLLVTIRRKQKQADAEAATTDADLREKVDSAMRDSV